MKDSGIVLRHILEAIDKIAEYTHEGAQAFGSDSKTQDAVIRNLEIIGEAVKSLPEAARSAEPEIPWKQIAGMRDKLIHAYFGVDLTLVWEVVEHSLPPLRAAVQRLLED